MRLLKLLVVMLGLFLVGCEARRETPPAKPQDQQIAPEGQPATPEVRPGETEEKPAEPPPAQPEEKP